MTVRVAINGYGRIGRKYPSCPLRSGKKNDIQIVAINDLGDAKSNAHLTRSRHRARQVSRHVAVEGDYMIVQWRQDQGVRTAQSRPMPLGANWRRRCGAGMPGFFSHQQKASAHLKGGAKKSSISAHGRPRMSMPPSSTASTTAC